MGIATNDLNKNDILNIGKIPESQLNAYIQEIQSIKQANYGNFESLQIQEYANALSDLDSTQTALLLKTQGLTISEKTENLASLRKQLSVFENDNSEESLKKVQQLQSDIKDAENKG